MHFQQYLPKSNRFRFTFTFILQHEVIASGYIVTDCIMCLKNPVVGCFIVNYNDPKACNGGNNYALNTPVITIIIRDIIWTDFPN